MVKHLLLRRNDAARVLTVSMRKRSPEISRCTLYEFEDLVGEFDAAEMVCPLAPKAGWWTHRLLGRAHRWTGWHPQLRQAPALLDRDYELAFFCCEDVEDLLRLGPMSAWLQRAEHKVCYVEEMWARDLIGRRHEIALLASFDHVFVSCAGAVRPLAEAIDRPVSFLAPSVDVATFAPRAVDEPRPVDIYAMGRRSPVTHSAFLALAKEHGLFYIYDTYAANRVLEPREHRFLLANLIKRSKFFVANRAKIDQANTRDQEEIGSRHFEGAAGGAVLIGEPPQCQTYLDNFDWPDAVVPMRWNTERPLEVLAELEADPARVARIRRDNLRHSLLRHDWVYRWEQILKSVGMQPLPQLLERKQRLQQQAALLVPPAPMRARG
jgi:hypothetical protein